jgi:Leucine-rich repeat (LRR) protein
MARVGLIHPEDRIENVPGSWVSVMAARQIREALAQRATSGLYLTATSASAALVALRFAVADLIADQRGRAVLLALVAQHPQIEVAAEAAQALSSASPGSTAILVSQIIEARRNRSKQGLFFDSSYERLRQGIVQFLGDDAWGAFADAVRQIPPLVDQSSGTAALWAPQTNGVGVTSTHLVRQPRVRSLTTDSLVHSVEEAIELMRVQARSIIAEESSTMDCASYPIDDLDALPEDIKQAMRMADVVDLSGTHIRRVPAWLFHGKSAIDLSASLLQELPSLDPAPSEGSSPYENLSINVLNTRVDGIPPSWASHTLREIDLSGCPLHPESFVYLPKCDIVTANHAQLQSVGAFGAVPKSLYMANNFLVEIPMALRFNSAALKNLDLSGNQISQIPSWINELPSLAKLDLSNNVVRSVVLPLSDHPMLTEVHLEHNGLSEVGPSVFSGRRMKYIDLSGNQISVLPPMVYPTDYFSVSDNPLRALPDPLNDFSALEVAPPTDDSFEIIEIEWTMGGAVDIGNGDENLSDAGNESEVQDDEQSVELVADDEELLLMEDAPASADTLESIMDDEVADEWVDDEDEDEDDAEDDDEGEDEDEDEDDDEDDDEDEDEYQAETGAPLNNILTVDASETLIEEFPDSLLDLKLEHVVLKSCPRLRLIPEEILSMGTLSILDCSHCPSLRSVRPGKKVWSLWPKERREAVIEAIAELDRTWSSPLTVSLVNSGFQEVPGFLAKAESGLMVDLDGAPVQRWNVGATSALLVSIELLNTQLSQVPDLGQFSSTIKTLCLPADAGLVAIAPGLSQCTLLESLTLPGLPDSAYPLDLSSLAALTELTLHGYGLTEIPRFIATLPNLKTLTIRGTSITELPALLARCAALTTISVDQSPLRRIDPKVLGISSLEALDLTACAALDFPEFPQGCMLKSIVVTDGGLVRIPSSVERCRSLEKLIVNGSGLCEFPDSVTRMPWLNEISGGLSAYWNHRATSLRQHLPCTEF